MRLLILVLALVGCRYHASPNDNVEPKGEYCYEDSNGELIKVDQPYTGTLLFPVECEPEEGE